MLNPIHLQTLRECVQTGSFAEAGRILGYTASAISQQMASLERAIGVPLFERSAQKIRPSSLAYSLAESSESVLVLLERLESDAREMASGSRGSLRVGGFPTANLSLLPQVLSELSTGWHNLDLHLIEGEPDELLAHLLRGTIDCAIVFDYSLRPRVWPSAVEAVYVADDPLSIVVPASKLTSLQGEDSLAALADERWVAADEGTAGAETLGMICAESGFAPNVIFRSNNYHAAQEFVVRGLGVAIVPSLVLRPDVCRWDLETLTAKRRIFALLRTDGRNVVLERFRELLVREGEEHSAVHTVQDQ